jgi:ABC-type lipoprotein export system ATPase subunit
MIELKGVTKFYNNNGVVSLGLRNINLNFNKNEIIALCGESGSGKSTLLNVITKMDKFDEGEIYYKGEETSYFDVSDMDKFRKNKVGFIFQNYNIIESFTVLDNVKLPLIINGYSNSEATEKALELIEKVGLTKRKNNRGSHLSGGEKQRCVIARALAYDCEILACDEPTGNLDSKTGDEIIKLIKEVAKDKLVIIVSHNFEQIKDIVTRKITLKDGEVIRDEVFDKVEEIPEKNVELEEKEIKFKAISNIAYNGLKSTPKKTIFLGLIFIIISLLSLIVIALYIKYAAPKYDYKFMSVTDNAVYGINRDGIDYNDIKEYKNIELNPLEYLYGCEFSHRNIEDNYNYSMHEVYAYDANANKNILFGKKAEKSNEVNLCLNKNITQSMINAYINLDINVNGEVYTITGISFSDYQCKPALFNNEELKYKMRYYNYGCNMYNTSTDSYTQLPVYYSKTKKPGIYIKDRDKYDFSKSNISCRYRYDIYDSLKYKLDDFEVFTSEDDYIVVNEELDKTNIKTVYIYDINESKTLSDLGNKNIMAVSIHNTYEKGMSGPAVTLLVTLIFLFMGSFIITYIILKIAYNSNTDFFNIIRTLGVMNNSMKKIVILQVLTIGLTTSILVGIVIFILSHFIGNDFFLLFKISPIYTYFLANVFMLVLSYLVSVRFNKKLFKKTVNSSFERRGK